MRRVAFHSANPIKLRTHPLSDTGRLDLWLETATSLLARFIHRHLLMTDCILHCLPRLPPVVKLVVSLSHLQHLFNIITRHKIIILHSWSGFQCTTGRGIGISSIAFHWFWRRKDISGWILAGSICCIGYAKSTSLSQFSNYPSLR